MAKSETIKNEDIWQKDKLGIKQHVTSFANILKQEKYEENGTSKVYSISAEFGVGKTFFCERLADILEQDDVPVSMLNIWKMDFYDNPLVPLLIKLEDTYSQQSETVRTKKFPNPNRLLRVAKSIIAGINLDAQIPGVGEMNINGEKMVNTNESLKQNSTQKSIYDEYKTFEEELHKIKSFLENWAKSLERPIVVIIDELDRCRPDYAVKTLETLKHFFDIPGFVFVLAIDEVQLKSSVETLYGTKNFDGYKRKFINNSFVLPEPDKVKFTEYLYAKSGLDHIIKQIENNQRDLVFRIRRNAYIERSLPARISTEFQEELNKIKTYNQQQTSESIIKRYFAAYSIRYKFSLRQMEQVFDRLVLFIKNILANNVLFSPDLAVFLVCLHEFDLAIYTKLKQKGYIGYDENMQTVIIGSNTSLAYSIYDKNSFSKVSGVLDNNIVPKVHAYPGFSSTQPESDLTNSRICIHHNVDRFFKADKNTSMGFITDTTKFGESNQIDNGGRITIVRHPQTDSQWKTPPPDIDTASDFDLDVFKQVYFENVEFVSNFS